MTCKTFLTINEQIIKLKTLGITVTNEKTVKSILSENSFYNILNGYREPFLFMVIKTNMLKT